jgi:hypothetical protein
MPCVCCEEGNCLKYSFTGRKKSVVQTAQQREKVDSECGSFSPVCFKAMQVYGQF